MTTSRAARRRYAILGVLAEDPPAMHADTIGRKLGIRERTLCRDLDALVCTDRVKRLSGDGSPSRTVYRLATPTERGERRRPH